VWPLEVGVSFSTASSTATARVEEFSTCVKLNETSLQLRQAHRRLQHTDTKTKSSTAACDPEMIEVMSFSPLSEKLNENNY